MWLRYGVHMLLVCSSYASLSSDEEIAKWVLSQKNKTEPVTEALDLTPTFIKKTNKLDLTPTNIQTTLDCLLDDGKTGQCIPYYQCDAYNNIIVDGSSLIDFRQNKKCPSSLQVCCAIQNTEELVQDSIENHHGTPDEQAYNTDKMMQLVSSSVDLDKCGWTNIQPSTSPDKRDQQSSGQAGQASYQEFRWMVAIMKKRRGVTVWVPNDFLAGGSLIHPSVVITAAYHVNQYRNRELKVRAGEFNIQTENEAYKFQEQDVNKKIIHPEYYRPSLYYNAALVFLKHPFNLDAAPHIGLACLNKALPEPGTECFTMGWGKLPTEQRYPTTLKKSKLPLVSPEVCETNLRTTLLGRYFKLHSSLTCAGGQEGEDACYNDGGGPLVCPIQEDGANVRYAMVGIVAYGIGCGVKDRPGVYVNVPAVYAWVDTVMAEEKYGTYTYTV